MTTNTFDPNTVDWTAVDAFVAPASEYTPEQLRTVLAKLQKNIEARRNHHGVTRGVSLPTMEAAAERLTQILEATTR